MERHQYQDEAGTDPSEDTSAATPRTDVVPATKTVVQTAERQSNDTRFQPGRSGNPSGRPPGSRNKRAILTDRLLQDEADYLLRSLIEQAKAGDGACLRFLADRLLPRQMQPPIPLDLPDITCPNDVARAHSDVMRAVVAGRIGLREGERFMSLIDRTAEALTYGEYGGSTPYYTIAEERAEEDCAPED